MYSDTDFQARRLISCAASLMTSIYKKRGIPSLGKYIKRDKPTIGNNSGKDSINGVYGDDCNISLIDKQIKEILFEPKETSQITLKITAIQQELLQPHTLIRDKVLKLELKELHNKLRDYETNEKLIKYINETKEIIDRYKILREKVIVTIGIGADGIKGSMKESEESYIERMSLISMFLDIAKKYVKLNLHKIVERDNTCSICDIEYIESEDFYYCPNCGMQFSKVKEIAMEKDQKGYESRLNFIEAFNKLQGKDSMIPQDLYEQLDQYCSKNSIPVSMEIKSMDLNSDGTRGNVNFDLLQLILKKTGNESQYKNMSLISHEYWGWTLYNDLDEYKDKIMNEYELLESVLCSIREHDESSPNVQYKLYRLVSRSYPQCSKSHFRLPKDTGSLESKTFNAYKVLGWKFTSLMI